MDATEVNRLYYTTWGQFNPVCIQGNHVAPSHISHVSSVRMQKIMSEVFSPQKPYSLDIKSDMQLCYVGAAGFRHSNSGFIPRPKKESDVIIRSAQCNVSDCSEISSLKWLMIQQ